MTDLTTTARRPGVITLVGVWLWVIGLYNTLVGIIVIITRNQQGTIDKLGAKPSNLLIAGAITLALGLGIIATAVALQRGSRGARGLIAFFMVARIVLTGLALLVGNDSGNTLVAGLIHVLLPIAVLWAMYGNDRASEYFDSRA